MIFFGLSLPALSHQQTQASFYLPPRGKEGQEIKMAIGHIVAVLVDKDSGLDWTWLGHEKEFKYFDKNEYFYV
jgi:hypothetical protein